MRGFTPQKSANSIDQGLIYSFVDCLHLGLANYSVKGQIVNIFGFVPIQRLSDLLTSAVVGHKQSETICKIHGRGCVPINFIYKNRLGARFGPQSMVY